MNSVLLTSIGQQNVVREAKPDNNIISSIRKLMSIKQHLQDAALEFSRALAVGALIGAMLMIIYLAFEPIISRAVTDTFEVTQQITGEISFATPAADVTMSPALPSLTGGTSTGATQVVVSTNSATGYTMDIGTSSIPNFGSTTVPAFTFSAPANSASFGYSVEASTTSDVDPSFLDNGTACNTGTGNTADRCWLSPTSTAPGERIINRATIPPASGATTTVKFQLIVSPNPNPSIPADFYTATATLTALNQ